MSKPLDILNPDEPLLGSDDEDDDFEPEVPISNDGLFVTTRSGKGWNQDIQTEIEDVDIAMKRKARQQFDEMMREEEKSNDDLRRKQKLDYGFLNMVTTQEDGISYYKNLSEQNYESACTINGTTMDVSNEELQHSIQDAVRELRKGLSKEASKHVVKFAGEKIEISGSNTDSQGLDTLVKSLEAKKSLSTIDKSSYDWDKFKDKEGIKEEVEAAKKNGYIEKQEFLNRVDQRQFEKERAQRERERIKRENEKRQRRMFHVY